MKPVRHPFIMALVATMCICGPAHTHGPEQALSSGLPAGPYTGAEQVMRMRDGQAPDYRDNLDICHIEIQASGNLKADFPTSTGIPEGVDLKISATEPRVAWTARLHGNNYKVTAIPFSPEAYVFRLEILHEGKLIGGAQQFYAICRLKNADTKANGSPK